ncbi:hypothetical protein [Pseudomonas sp. PONIH3]|uniref:hypothetical protein n=1 Tax=Pseudomonas sp. PONIH3 TaxID=1636610 RepID=UPI003D2BE300
MNEVFYLPFPLPEESPTSLLKRFALKHGCVTRAQFSSLGIPLSVFNALSRNGEPAVWLADRSGIYKDKVLSGFYAPLTAFRSNRHYSVNNLLIKNSMIRWSGRGLCSDCWHEGMEHFLKDIRFCFHCPLHTRAYLFNCPHCGALISWFDALTLHCRACENELISPPCTIEDTNLEQKLFNWFRGSKQENIDLLEHALHALNYTYPVSSGDPNRATLLIAVAIVENDQKTLSEFLNTLHSCHPHLERRIIAAALSNVETEVSRKVVESFLDNKDARHPDTSGSSSTPYRQPGETFSLARTQIRKLLNLPRSVLLALYKETQHIWKSVGRQRMIPENLILELVEKADEFRNRPIRKEPERKGMTLGSTAQRLGVTRHRLNRIIQEGLLEVTVHGDNSYSVNERQIRNFEDRYETLAQFCSRTNTDRNSVILAMQALDIIPLPAQQFTYAVPLERSVTDRLGAYLEARVPHEKHPRVQRAQLAFIDEAEIDKYCRSQKASELSNLSPCTIAKLIRDGWLIARRRKRRGNSLYLLKTDVEAAKYDFLKAEEFARIIGTVHNLATKLLISLGLKPLAGPFAGCGDTTIFHREDIEEIVRKNSSHNNETMTILEASSYLKLSVSTVTTLLITREISADCNGAPSNLFIDKSKADEFLINHISATEASKMIGISPSKIQTFLKNRNILPTHRNPNEASETFFLLRDLQQLGFKLVTNSSNETYLDGFVSLPDACNKLKISLQDFTKHFTKTGYVNTIRARDKDWISHEDHNKVRQFLKAYCTLAMADSRAGAKGRFKYLIDIGAIRIATKLPPQLAAGIFISKRAVAIQIKRFQSSPGRRY